MAEPESAQRNRRVADPNSPQYAVHHAGHGRGGRRFLSRTGELVGEFLGEVVFGLVGLALLAGLSAATAYTWQHSRMLFIGVSVAVVAFLGYGVTHLVRSWLGRSAPRWPRLAFAAGVAVALCALWASSIPYPG